MNGSRLLTHLLKSTLAALSAVCILTSCSDDDPPAFKPLLPANGGAPVKTISYLGNVPSSCDWTFTYAYDRLLSAVGNVHNSTADTGKSYTYTSRIAYKHNAVTVNNSTGERINVLLNSRGYIEKMTVNLNVYNFQYSTDGYLTAWEKLVYEDSFGQLQQYRTTGQISYVNGDLDRIIYTEPDNNPVTLTFTASYLPNMNGLLPATASRELGCLGFEHLYYAGLLGRSTRQLVKAIHYEYADATRNYTTEFEYSNRNGNTILCNFHTADGGVASISYGY